MVFGNLHRTFDLGRFEGVSDYAQCAKLNLGEVATFHYMNMFRFVPQTDGICNPVRNVLCCGWAVVCI